MFAFLFALFSAIDFSLLQQIPKSTIHDVLKKTLRWKPFKYCHVQKLTPSHHRLRKKFCEWLLEKPVSFADKVLWSDEKWWVLHRRPNRQNERYWAAHNPHQYAECNVQGDVKAMSWVGVMDGKVVSVYWFIDDAGRNVAVNQQRYLKC